MAGEQHHLIGATTDFGAEVGEAGITYGVATAYEIAATESRFAAPLQKLMDTGVTLQSRARSSPIPVRLVELDPLPVEQNGGHITVYVYSPEQHIGALADQNRYREQFTAQRAAALKMRLPFWSIEDMDHRADFPIWMPEFARELVREHSRTWLELPSAPKGFIEPSLLPPPRPAQRTTHPTMPQNADGRW